MHDRAQIPSETVWPDRSKRCATPLEMNGKQLLATLATVIFACWVPSIIQAQTCRVLHIFRAWRAKILDRSGLAEGVLYGTGGPGKGMLFRVNADGTAYTNLHTFTGIDGEFPCGNLIVSDSVLYGAAGSGGSFRHGTVFKINTDGSGFFVLKHFAFSEGNLRNLWHPRSGLTISGTTLMAQPSKAAFTSSKRMAPDLPTFRSMPMVWEAHWQLGATPCMASHSTAPLSR